MKIDITPLELALVVDLLKTHKITEPCEEETKEASAPSEKDIALLDSFGSFLSALLEHDDKQ